MSVTKVASSKQKQQAYRQNLQYSPCPELINLWQGALVQPVSHQLQHSIDK
jgi:hypothetical protein